VLVFPSNFLVLDLVFAVTAVASGIQAWKFLEDPTNQMDLILTEVAMPLLSGIGLLSKIMNHKTLKNVPVISKYHLNSISSLSNLVLTKMSGLCC
jgi:CheY-like chemotaxis protein